MNDLNRPIQDNLSNMAQAVLPWMTAGISGEIVEGVTLTANVPGANSSATARAASWPTAATVRISSDT